MKKVKYTDKQVTEKKTKSLKRRTWYCRKNKGDHLFELVFPTYYFRLTKKNYTSPEEYYDDRDSEESKLEQKFRWLHRLRYWKCHLCEKRAYDCQEKPDKRIRNNLWIK